MELHARVLSYKYQSTLLSFIQSAQSQKDLGDSETNSMNLESCETDDEASTFFVTIEPYFNLARGQRPGTKLRWNYDVRSNSVGLTCSRLDTIRVISPLEWKFVKQNFNPYAKKWWESLNLRHALVFHP